MQPLLVYAAAAALLAGLATHLLVPLVARLAIAVQAVDHPGERRRHAGVVPRLGGIALAGGIAVGGGAAALARWSEVGRRIPPHELGALMAGTAIVFFVGIVDDLRDVGAPAKFLFELGAAALVVHAGWSFQVLRLPLVGEIQLGVFGSVVSLFWIVGVTNAINMIDGLDGLAGGVVAIISSSLLVYAVLQGNPGSVVLMAATAGACIGFLRHNFLRARIFMGDCGALTLGFLLGAISIHSSLKAPAAVAILVPILALGLPVIETLLLMLVRFRTTADGSIASRFAGMFRADNQHLHHVLSSDAPHHRRIVLGIWVVALFFCAMALLVAVRPDSKVAIGMVTVEFAVVIVMRQPRLVAAARGLWRKRGDEEDRPGSGAERPHS